MRIQKFFLALICAISGALMLLTLRVAGSHLTRDTIGALTMWQYVFLIVLGAATFLSFIRRVRSRMFWEVILTFLLFMGIWYLFLFLLPPSIGIVVASALILAHLFFRLVFVQDAVYVIGASGAAIAVAGWLSPEALVAILVVLTLYDMVAGPLGGPVESLARLVADKGLVPGFVVPTKLTDAWAPIDEALRSHAALFGASDLILPLCLVARASIAGAGQGLVVLAGLLLAVCFLGETNNDHPRALLPALAAGTVLPFIVLRLFSFI